MIAEYKTKTNIGVGIGFLLQIFGRSLASIGGTGGGVGVLIQLFSAILFIWGCCMYAKGKGYHPAWGLLGFLSIIGLIVLVCFKDKHK